MTDTVIGKRSQTKLTGPELMAIAKDSVVNISINLGTATISHGTAFAYKQVKDSPAAGLSRLFFVTNLHNLKGALGAFPLLLRAARQGAPADVLRVSMSIEFMDVRYEIDSAKIVRNTLFSDNTFADDFAFFSVDVPVSDDLQMYAIPGPDDAVQGAACFAFGFPQNTDLGITEGIVSHVYGDDPKDPTHRWQIQHSILINGGNSGGPTVNENGVAIGISTWGLVGRGNVTGINFSVNLHSVFERSRDPKFLEEVALRTLFDKLTDRAIEHNRFGN